MRRSWGAWQVELGGAVLAGVALFLSLGAGKASLPGREVVTSIVSEGIGRIAVRVALPDRPRYPEGAPVVVEVPTYATPVTGFDPSLPAPSLGAVHLTLLWPGRSDPRTGASSEGVDNFGGPTAIRALRDVIRFACGEIRDVSGRAVGELSPIPVLTANVGLYAFSHPGIPATIVLSRYGQELAGVTYFVGGENPTNDALFSVEVGHWGTDGRPIENPYYDYPEGYTADRLVLETSHVDWQVDAAHPDGVPAFRVPGGEDYVLGDRVPRMGGKRYYSVAVAEALLRNGALTEGTWPADVATASEARANWPDRMAVGHYAPLATAAPSLKVMLVFGNEDHVQVALDKPHIHQAYDGFREQAGLWVRLNPDRSYVAALLGSTESRRFPDNPANSEPSNWLDVGPWSVPAEHRQIALLAAVAEMMDRTRLDVWGEDLATVLTSW
jgi:hypothetical protein